VAFASVAPTVPYPNPIMAGGVHSIDAATSLVGCRQMTSGTQREHIETTFRKLIPI
jgi:hypothetical protein